MQNQKNLLNSAIGILIGLGVLAGTVYVVGKAWKASQK